MSIKRVNSTGRKKILREDVRIFVKPEADGVLSFDAKLLLEEYELPPDARVFIEAYRQTTFMRFDYGTVASPEPQADTPCLLTEFSTTDGLLFRVKVTSIGDRPGVLLAEADRIPICDDQEQPDNRLPLLPPAPAELGQEVWSVDLFNPGGPLLLINEKVGDWKAVARLPQFRCLVYPTALRFVLTHILMVEEIYDLEDGDSWQSRWLKFAQNLGASDPPTKETDENDKSEWIENVVCEFSRKHKLLDHFHSALVQEESA